MNFFFHIWILSLHVSVFVSLSVCVSLCMCCVYKVIYVCGRQKSVFLGCSSSYYLRQSLSEPGALLFYTASELLSSRELSLSASSPAQHWGYRCMLTCMAFPWVLNSGLYDRRHFYEQAMSPGLGEKYVYVFVS